MLAHEARMFASKAELDAAVSGPDLANFAYPTKLPIFTAEDHTIV